MSAILDIRGRPFEPEPAPKKRPVVRRIEHPIYDAPGLWDIKLVRTAISEHEDGQFHNSGRLSGAVTRDSRIQACLQAHANSILAQQEEFVLLPASESTADVIDDVSIWWEKVFTDSVLTSIIYQTLLMGFSISRVHWKRDSGSWTPVFIEPWAPANVIWDDFDRSFILRTDNAGDITVRYGDPNWLIVTRGGSYPWLQGSIRSLGEFFVYRTFNWRDWARFNERHGQPIIGINEPSGEYMASDKDAFYASLSSMSSNGIVRLPKDKDGYGFGLDMIEAKDRAHSSFLDFRRNIDIDIAVNINGQNLLTEAHTGSLGLARVQNQIRTEYRRATVEFLSTNIRSQVIHSWGVFNIPGWDSVMAPWPSWNTSDAFERVDFADAMKKASEAARFFDQSPLRHAIDWKAFADKFDIPLLDNPKFKSVEAIKEAQQRKSAQTGFARTLSQAQAAHRERVIALAHRRRGESRHHEQPI